MPRDLPPTRSAQKAQTREQLKAAARACFARRGYAATQITDIAKAAGVAAGTMYVHFPSKESILDELLAELDRELVTRLADAWNASATDGPPRDLEARVRAVALACLGVWQAERDLLRTFAERATLGLDARRIHEGVSPSASRWLAELIRNAAPLLGGPIAEPGLVAHALLGLWLRVGLASLFDPSPSREELAELLTRLTLGALRGVAAPAASAPAQRPASNAGDRRRSRTPRR